MIEYTNNFNIPQEIVNVLVPYEKKYTENTFSVTDLISSPQKRELLRRFDVVIDYSALLSRFKGNLLHNYFQQKTPQLLTEQFVERKIEYNGVEYTIRGVADILLEDKIVDYKTTKHWKFIFKDFSDWETQLNLYKWLTEFLYDKEPKLFVWAFIDDYTLQEAKRNKDYPQIAFKEVEIPSWDTKQTEEYILDRLKRHLFIQSLSDEELTTKVFCTKKERLANDEKFAVMKQGRKSAIKLYDNLEDAIESMPKDGKHYVEERPSISKCVDYCDASSICPIRLNPQHKERFMKANPDTYRNELKLNDMQFSTYKKNCDFYKLSNGYAFVRTIGFQKEIVLYIDYMQSESLKNDLLELLYALPLLPDYIAYNREKHAKGKVVKIDYKNLKGVLDERYF